MHLLREGLVERRADGQLLFRVDSTACSGCRGCARRGDAVLMLPAATPISGMSDGPASLAVDRRQWQLVMFCLFGVPVLAAAFAGVFASLSGVADAWTAPIALAAAGAAAWGVGYRVRPYQPVVHLRARPVDHPGSY